MFPCSMKPENCASWTSEDWPQHVVARLHSHSNLSKMAARSWSLHIQSSPERYVSLIHLAIYETCSTAYLNHQLPDKPPLNLNEIEPKHTQLRISIDLTKFVSRTHAVTQLFTSITPSQLQGEGEGVQNAVIALQRYDTSILMTFVRVISSKQIKIL